MLLTYRDCSALRGKEWCLLEVRSEKTIEPTLRRIGKAIPCIFQDNAVEIFIPVGLRDLDVFELKAAAYLFVRSAYFPGLLRLKTITGVVSLVTEGDSNRPSKVIKVEDSYVQEQIRVAEKGFREHSAGVEVGSFVRVLNGETRDFCGIVKAVNNQKAVVRIRLKTKSIMLETPVTNLLNLPRIPAELRTYYYCPLVENLHEDEKREGDTALPGISRTLDAEEALTVAAASIRGVPDSKQIAAIREVTNGKKSLAAKKALDIGEALDLIRRDASPGEPVLISSSQSGKSAKEMPKRLRQRTVTALVRKIILIDSECIPMTIAARVVASIKAGEIRPPKNPFIVYTIIKDSLMKHFFKKRNPEFKSYRDAVKHYGDAYRFSARQIAKLDPGLKVLLAGKKG